MPSPAPLPTTVKVGPHAYTVTIDKQACRKAGVDGQMSATKATIILAPGQAPTALRDTLLHEVLHAACCQAGVQIGDTFALLDEEGEERLVWQLAPILLGVLRDNPTLVSFLLG